MRHEKITTAKAKGPPMKRAAIYARFSTDLQNERSVEDQIALCREHARRDGYVVVEVFSDKAVSGASIFNRDGLLNLMERSQAAAFDVLIVEALDRLARDMEDLAGIHKRLTFRGIQIRAVHDGIADTVMVGLRGLVGQMQREDGAKKVRRGMSAVIRDARHAGGRAYGYLAQPGESRGRLVVVESEAEIVRRIFTEWIAGRTARDIAHDLNRDGVAPPRGGKAWNASTIYGNGKRGCGIIRNELYDGRLVWNRLRMVKDPETGRRVSRVNAADQRQTTSVPDLAIVAPEIFAVAQARLAERAAIAPTYQRRPRHILSGLLRCDSCGSGMSTFGADKSGRKRLRCSRARESGTCPAPKTFYLDTIERAVLEALSAELRDPRLLAEYAKTYHEERQRLAGTKRTARARAERRLAELVRESDRLVTAIAKGLGDPEELGERHKSAAQERRTLQAELAQEPAKVIALHPGALSHYEAQIERLQAAIAKGIARGNPDYAEALRDLVETVTVRRDPGRPGGIEITIAGRLNSLLGEKAFPNGLRRAVCGLVVAEDGFEPPTRGL
jgi:site-specific DNA recombinase